MGVVTCRLWRILPRDAHKDASPQYAVELAGLGQRRMHPVGSDLRRAEAIVSLLARHTVTPCTLRDVLEDLEEDGDDP